MVEVIGGSLYQWDIDRQVKINTFEPIDEIHFAMYGDSEALVVEAVENGRYIVANIPNILLQKSGKLNVYLVKNDVTIERYRLQVKRREKPADYVYTETEIKRYAILEERVEALEKIETDSKYFDINHDGIVSLKPKYRGDVASGTYSYAVSDNDVGNAGSKNNELPENIVVPEVIGTTAVTGFQEGTFQHNRRIKSLVIPKSVTTLPKAFVRDAYNLETLEGTDNVTHVDNTAFTYCGIKKLSFPSLKTLGNSVFGMSPNLVVVDIGNNITELPKNTFTQCCNLSCVVGGSKITTIRESAFYLTRRLRNLPFLSQVTSIEKNAFFDSRVNFENVYDTLVANGCTFGTNATYKQVQNGNDYWSGVAYTPCENPIKASYHQKDPRWVNLQIGEFEGITYGGNGCAYVTGTEIYNTFENDSKTPPEFVAMLQEKGLASISMRNREGFTQVMNGLGYQAEFITIIGSDLAKVYQALKDGALLYLSHMIIGNTSGGHATLCYGINDIGEMLISDSDSPLRYIEIYTNHTSSKQIYAIGDSNIDVVIVKKS